MPRLKANGVELEYEVQGDPAARPLLLIMGLGAQLITWDDGFCDALAARDFYVIRYDNRDSGLSEKMDAAGPADLLAAYSGVKLEPAYTLGDMADDAVGVLQALNIPAAHIVGASMGGFIAQLVAINHPDRTLSVTSIMSGPGGEDTVPPTAEAAAVLIEAPGPSREERIQAGLRSRALLCGEGNPFDPVVERRRIERALDRSYYPEGYGRQLIAILAAKSRMPALANVHVPTLVVHGVDDPLVPIENGRLVARAVPGARIMELEGMGHNTPERYWASVAGAIAELASQAAPLGR